MKMQRLIVPLLVGAALVAITVFIVRGQAGAGRSSATITLGAILPMTGDQALSGQEESRGLQLAIDHLNATRGETARLELKIEDSRGQAKEAVTAVKKLMEQDRSIGVFTSLTGVSRAVIPLTSPDKAVVIVFGMDESLAEGGNVFRVYPGIREEGRKINEIIDRVSPRKLAILSFDQGAINAQVDEILLPAQKSRGMPLLAERFSSLDGTALKAIADKIRDFNPDALVVNAYYNQIPLVVRILLESGLPRDLPLIGGLNFAIALSNDQSFNPAFNKVYLAIPRYVYESAAGIEQATRTDFVRTYQRKWGGTPSFDAAYAYDGALLLGAAARQGKGNAEQIMHLLLKGSEFAGATGKLRFDNKGSSLSDWIAVESRHDESTRPQFKMLKSQ